MTVDPVKDVLIYIYSVIRYVPIQYRHQWDMAANPLVLTASATRSVNFFSGLGKPVPRAKDPVER